MRLAQSLHAACSPLGIGWCCCGHAHLRWTLPPCRLLEDAFLVQDPAALKRKALILGSCCCVCQRQVCTGEACSLFYTKRFCAPCARANAAALPQQIHKASEVHTEQAAVGWLHQHFVLVCMIQTVDGGALMPCPATRQWSAPCLHAICFCAQVSSKIFAPA